MTPPLHPNCRCEIEPLASDPLADTVDLIHEVTGEGEHDWRIAIGTEARMFDMHPLYYCACGLRMQFGDGGNKIIWGRDDDPLLLRDDGATQ